MKRFKLELGFRIPAGEIHDEVMDLLAWLGGDDEPDNEADVRSQGIQLNEVLTAEVPFSVSVDDEPWSTVDPTSTDRYLVKVTMKDAILTDDVLEKLPVYEDRIEAASWAIMTNQWDIEITSLRGPDMKFTGEEMLKQLMEMTPEQRAAEVQLYEGEDLVPASGIKYYPSSGGMPATIVVRQA